MTTRRILASSLVALALAGASQLAACSSSDGSVVTTDASVTDGASRADAADAAPATDAANEGDAADASVADANGPDANGPGQQGDACTFNRECMAALRCECNQATSTGCACKTGARGSGKNGIDPCPGDDGSNLCASALCVEGPAGEGNFCSDECKTDADCTGKLPRCEDVSFVGRICVRQP